MGKYYLGTGTNQYNFQVVDSTGVINDLNLSGLYLSITGKAADADKLDNYDSAFFRNAANLTGTYTGTVSGKAADSELLDGFDSSYFLNGANITGTVQLSGTFTGYYTGAFSGTITHTDYIQFHTGLGINPDPAELTWNDDVGTMQLGLDANVDLRVGFQNYEFVTNRNASTLSKGSVVYISGAQGNRPAVALALANADSTSAVTFGILAEDIASMADGYAITNGLLTNLNTTGFAEGVALYLSPTVSGAIISTKPQAPQHSVLVGFCVRSHASAGEILVKIQNGLEIDELHDVRILNKQNNDIIRYHAPSGVWYNSDTLAINGTGANYISGDLGIGTSGPTAKLHILGADKRQIIASITDNAALVLGQWDGATNRIESSTRKLLITSYASGISLGVNGSENVHVSTSGNLGVGTLTPAQKLTIGNGGKIAVYTAGDGRRGLFFNDGTGTWLESDSSGSDPLLLSSPGTNGSIRLYTNGTEKVRLDNNGNVGIGSTAPSSKLTIGTDFASIAGITVDTGGGTDSQLVLRKAASKPAFGVLAWENQVFLSAGIYYDGGNWVHSNSNNSNQLFVLNPGTGATWYASNSGTPSWNIASDVVLWNDSGYWKNLIQSTASGNSYFTGGSVGIGSTSPNQKLEIKGGNVRIDNRAAGSYSASDLEFLSGDSSGSWNVFKIRYTKNASLDRLEFIDGGNSNAFIIANGGNVTALGNLNVQGSGTSVIDNNLIVGGGSLSGSERLMVRRATGGYTVITTDGTHSFGIYNGGGAAWLGTTSNHPLDFFTNGSGTQVRLTTAGNVGIGLVSPSSKLHIAGTHADEGADRAATTVLTLDTRTDGTGTGKTYFKTGWVNTGNYGVSTIGVGYWTGSNAVRDVLTLLGTGNVGIGTSLPAAKLDVAGMARFGSTNERVAIGHYLDGFSGNYSTIQTNSHGDFTFASNLVIRADHDLTTTNSHGTMQGAAIVLGGNSYTLGANTIAFFAQPDTTATAGTVVGTSAARMVIKNSGNVGIGTTSPSTKLEIVESGTTISTYGFGLDTRINTSSGGWARANRIYNSAASAGYSFFGLNGTGTTTTRAYWTIGDPASIDATGFNTDNGIFLLLDGKVGINTRNPTEKLQVAGSANIDGSINFLRGSGEYSTYIKANDYVDGGYSGSTLRYWIELGSKGGTHIVLNTDGSAAAAENAYDHFTIWQYTNGSGAIAAGARKFWITNTGRVNFIDSIWHKSSDGIERIYFGSSGSTFYKGGGTGNIHTFRNASDVDILTLNNAKDATFTGNVTVAGNITSSTSTNLDQLIRVTNSNAANSALSRLVVSNGTYEGSITLYGTGFTTNNAAHQNRMTIAAPFICHNVSGQHYWWIGTTGAGHDPTNANQVMILTTGGQFITQPFNYSYSAWGLDGINTSFRARTITDSSTAASGTAASAAMHSFAASTLAATNTSVTTTNAATVYIAGGPSAGTNQTITNSWGLWNAGKTRLDSDLFFNTDVKIYRSGANKLATNATGIDLDSNITIQGGGNITINAGSSGQLFLGTNGTTNAITINTSQNATFAGFVGWANGIAYPGGLGANGQARIYSSSTYGLVLYGQGSTSDILLMNRSGSSVITVPSNTTNVEFAGNILVSGNLTINGTTTTVNSTTITVDDPIFTLGGDTSVAETTKDRGIEFKWNGTTLTITNYIGNATTTVTGTVASTSGYAAGDIITISGATGTEQSKLNGTWKIASVPNASTFTFVVSSSVASATYTTNLGTTVKSKNGFFGLDQSSGYFTFIPQADNSSEVFSGTQGDIQASNFRGTLIGSLSNALTAGSYLTGSPSSTYNGSAAVTFAVDATSANTASKVVARDGNGDFSARIITANSFALDGGFTISNSGAYGQTSTWLGMTGHGIYTTGTTYIDLDGTTSTYEIRGYNNDTFAKFENTGTANTARRISFLINGGNVGIGTATPSANLDITGNARVSTYYNFNGNPSNPTNTTAALYDQSGVGPTISGLNVTFRAGSATLAEVMRISSGGTVGIGSTSPSALYRLTIDGVGTATEPLGGITFRQGGTDVLYFGNISRANNTDFELWNPRSGYLRFGTNNAERLNISASGKFKFTPSNYSLAAWTTTGSLTEFVGATVTDSSTAQSTTAASAVFHSFAVPTLAATNTSVTTTAAATVYIAGDVAAGTNQTITNSYGLWNVGKTRLDGNVIVSNALTVSGVINLNNNATFNGATTSINSSTIIVGNDASDLVGIANNTMYFDGTGKVGIGTTSPSQKLHVSGGNLLVNNSGSGDTNSGIRIIAPIATTHYNWMLAAQQNVNAAFEITPSTAAGGTTFSSPVAVFLQSGKVGIGTTSPDSFLQVKTTTAQTTIDDANQILTIENAAATDASGNLGGIRFRQTNGTNAANAFIGLSSTGSSATRANLVFASPNTSGNATTKMVIDSSGNVGVAVTSPLQQIHINGNILLDGTTNGYTQGATRGIGYGSNSGGVSVDGFSGMDIQSVNAPAPNAGNYSQNLRFFTHHYGTGTGGTPRMFIRYDGNVGIGSVSPGYKLEVNGSFAATTKSFVIKHPTKEGKKLRYGSLEGPENGVYVRGKTTSKVIELPDYWTKLVDPESITVQLTPIGSHQKLYVEKIEDNKVYIANENLLAKNVNCFFYILAERADVEKLQVEIDA
jgi:hypothetical protein